MILAEAVTSVNSLAYDVTGTVQAKVDEGFIDASVWNRIEDPLAHILRLAGDVATVEIVAPVPSLITLSLGLGFTVYVAVATFTQDVELITVLANSISPFVTVYAWSCPAAAPGVIGAENTLVPAL